MLLSALPLDQIVLDAGDPLEVALRAATSMLGAVVLAIIVALAYRGTHRGMQYSASFALALVMLAAIGTLVMMVIGDSLARAFGVFGALSLVRFRTAVKDPKDIAYVFLALAIGMAAGTGRFVIAGVGTVVMVLVIVGLSAIRFGSRVRDDYLVRVVYSGTNASAAVPQVLGEHSRRVVLLTLQGFGAEGVESTWLTTLKGRPDALMTALRGVEGVGDVHVTATAQEVEL